MNKKKRNIIVIIVIVILLLLAAILIPIAVMNNGDCEHTYDNACDTTCNECGEKREAGPHDFTEATCAAPKTCKICGATEGEALPHKWSDADCETPKTCQVCFAIEGDPLGHKPESDDGDCTTEVKCTVCGDVTIPAKTNHIAHADDGNCTTPVTCTACDTVITNAKAAHDHSGEALSDGDGHWHVCKTAGCTVTDTKTKHTKGADGKCTNCGYIVETTPPHAHKYTTLKYDESTHWYECSCGAKDDSTKASHSATDDHDCVTDDLCECGYTVTAAKDHVAGEDDGNCATAIGCKNCDKDAVAATTGHNDSNHDYLCDNPGCQVTVGTPPKDENEGIDLPIDRN